MTPHPTVAICMATWNPPPELFRRQIASLRAQGHTSWICFVQDDCSEEGSFENICSLLRGDARFIMERNERNLGFYRTFEKALSRVPGDIPFVALSDQDDEWYPEKLSRCLEAFDDRTSLVYSDMQITDADGGILSETYWKKRVNEYRSFEAVFFANTVTGASAVFRRNVLATALPFPGDVTQGLHDWWIALNAMLNGKFQYIDAPLYDYVQHGGNAVGHPLLRPKTVPMDASRNRTPFLPSSISLPRRLRHYVIGKIESCGKPREPLETLLQYQRTANILLERFGSRGLPATYKNFLTDIGRLSLRRFAVEALRSHWRSKSTIGAERHAFRNLIRVKTRDPLEPVIDTLLREIRFGKRCESELDSAGRKPIFIGIGSRAQR